MVLLSTAIGYALVAAGPLERNLERIAPVLGVLATAFLRGLVRRGGEG
jgi:hypothetical protein